MSLGKLRIIAKALKLTPTDKLHLEKGGRPLSTCWWLVGCVEGDQPLPRTSQCHTTKEAIEAAMGWLAPEIDTVIESKSKNEH